MLTLKLANVIPLWPGGERYKALDWLKRLSLEMYIRFKIQISYYSVYAYLDIYGKKTMYTQIKTTF